ncbi:TerD family protein, partial [Kitasatospora sp. NPDC057198]
PVLAAPAAPAVPAAVAAVPAVPAAAPDVRPDCFFDPAHGPAGDEVLWSPQWGAARPVRACLACAQRVRTTPPPYYAEPAAAGYPPTLAGQPQHGHPQQYGYDGHHPHEHQQGGGRRFGTGAMIGAGAAGLVGGALLYEALDDDTPDVVVNNYYED